MLIICKDVKDLMLVIFWGLGIGFLFGIFFGVGLIFVLFMVYGVECKVSCNCDNFGWGVIEGVVSLESVNNVVVNVNFVLILVFGIFGGVMIVVFFGVFMIFGL